jgi:hypothetical protein
LHMKLIEEHNDETIKELEWVEWLKRKMKIRKKD